MEDYSNYFPGKKLYGDNFTYEQIEEWYQDEQEALDGGQYVAGHYCKECWDNKYKAIEAKENYE